ncbi:MAG: MBL fold metallo-hydrolase [Bacillota bacterium]
MYEVARFGPVVRIRMSRAFLGRPTLWVHAFWVDGLLIDSGCHHTVPDLAAALHQEGLTVEQVVSTHSHEDHVGANAYIRHRFGVMPRAHPLALDRLARPETWREMDLYRQFFWGLVEGCPAEPLGEAVETDRYRFRVLHTPGHSKDHIALFEEQGWLFSGDLLISPRLQHVRREENPLLLLDSMRQVAALPVRQLFCSHAYRVHDSAQPLAEKVAYWEKLQSDGRALAREGLSVRAITRRLLPARGLIELLTRGDFSRINLMRGLLGEEQSNQPHL